MRSRHYMTILAVALAMLLSGQSTTMVVRPPNIVWIPNEAVTGTALNKLVKTTGAPSTGIITAAGDTISAVGICVGGCGTAAVSAVASIAAWGNASCVFDGATTAGNYFGVSATVAGDCTDVGAPYPTRGQALGVVLSTNGGAGTYPVVLSRSTGGVAGSLYLANTNSAVTGVLFKGTTRFIHNYADPTADGINTFVGLSAGNFTMGPGGGAATLASRNTAMGGSALSGNTTGQENTAQGVGSLLSNTTGSYNTAQGVYTLQASLVGNYNTAQGWRVLYNNTGDSNTAQGLQALYANTSGGSNVATGLSAGYTETPANANVTGSQNTWVGTEAGPGGVAQLTNSIGLGYRAHPATSNTAVLGNASITDTYVGGTGAASNLWAANVATVSARLALTAQAAAIATTNLLAAAPAGTYRVSAYLHTTTPSAGVCVSSLTIGWTYNGGAKTQTPISVHNQAVDENYSQGVGVLRSAAATNITYALDFTGAGCANTVYDLYAALERLQ